MSKNIENPVKTQNAWTVYMLRCTDDSLYTGITNNLENRLQQHNDGKGAKYTRSRRPVRLVFCESCENKGDALKREFAIKQLSRAQKLEMIRPADPTKDAAS